MSSQININGMNISVSGDTLTITGLNNNRNSNIKTLKLERDGTIKGYINGDLNVEGDNVTLIIIGDISGDVNCANLKVDGNIDGDVNAANVTAKGGVGGDVNAAIVNT